MGKNSSGSSSRQAARCRQSMRLVLPSGRGLVGLVRRRSQFATCPPCERFHELLRTTSILSTTGSSSRDAIASPSGARDCPEACNCDARTSLSREQATGRNARSIRCGNLTTWPTWPCGNADGGSGDHTQRVRHGAKVRSRHARRGSRRRPGGAAGCRRASGTRDRSRRSGVCAPRMPCRSACRWRPTASQQPHPVAARPGPARRRRTSGVSTIGLERK